MQCIECRFLDLKKDKTLSRHGFGFCTMTMATFYSLEKEHDCNLFIKADENKIEKRIEWYEKGFK
jgi:hypothetical protein